MRSDKYGNDKAQIKEARRSKAVVRDRHRITPLRVFGWLFKLAVILVIMACVAAAGYAAYIIYQAPEIDTTTLSDTLTESSIIYDDNNKKLDTVFEDENRTLVKYQDIPDNLINAFVALEDKTFWEHDGFNSFPAARSAVSVPSPSSWPGTSI